MCFINHYKKSLKYLIANAFLISAINLKAFAYDLPNSIKIFGLSPNISVIENTNTLSSRGFNCKTAEFFKGMKCSKGKKKIIIDTDKIFFNAYSFGGVGKKSNQISTALIDAFDLPEPIVGHISGFDDDETRYWYFADGSALLINTKNVIHKDQPAIHYWAKKQVDRRSEIKIWYENWLDKKLPLSFD